MDRGKIEIKGRNERGFRDVRMERWKRKEGG